jgi:NAD(P)-dependent dehydrogenase (short-subunit alcohol dehydrogenase family)
MDLKLAGKRALVTGSTGGIGLAIARRLAAEGTDVIMAGRSQSKLDAAALEVKAAARDGARILAILADAASVEGAVMLASAAPEVDILVNNLGIYEVKAFADITDADWLHMFEINVLGGIRLARQYFPGMLARDDGRVIFIASESGMMIPSDMIHYGMTKSAQISVARGLAELTRGTKVTVNSVLPGPTRSDGIGDFLRSVAADANAPAAQIEAEFFQEHRATSLLQRLIEPDEIAALVAYIASPLSIATNGAAVRTEGGLLPTL